MATGLCRAGSNGVPCVESPPGIYLLVYTFTLL